MGALPPFYQPHLAACHWRGILVAHGGKMLREVTLPKFAPFIQTMLKGGVGDVTHNPFFLFFILLITKKKKNQHRK